MWHSRERGSSQRNHHIKHRRRRRRSWPKSQEGEDRTVTMPADTAVNGTPPYEWDAAQSYSFCKLCWISFNLQNKTTEAAAEKALTGVREYTHTTTKQKKTILKSRTKMDFRDRITKEKLLIEITTMTEINVHTSALCITLLSQTINAWLSLQSWSVFIHSTTTFHTHTSLTLHTLYSCALFKSPTLRAAPSETAGPRLFSCFVIVCRHSYTTATQCLAATTGKMSRLTQQTLQKLEDFNSTQSW